jgi:hypothetical protein
LGAIPISTPDQEPGHESFETGQPAASCRSEEEVATERHQRQTDEEIAPVQGIDTHHHHGDTGALDDEQLEPWR